MRVSGREVLVCVNVHCVCVDMCRMINLCFAGGRESRCMWLFCTARCFFCFCFCFLGGVVFCLTQSLIQHPHWSACRSAASTPASLSLSLCFLCVSTEDLTSCPRVTVCLTSSLSLCYAVLAESLLSLSHRIV